MLEPGKQEFTGAELAEALGGKRPARLYEIMRREQLEATGNSKARRYTRPTVEALQDIFLRGASHSTSLALAVWRFAKGRAETGEALRHQVDDEDVYPSRTKRHRRRNREPPSPPESLICWAGKRESDGHRWNIASAP